MTREDGEYRHELMDEVSRLRQNGDKHELGLKLRELGEFERRLPGRHADVIDHYGEAIELLGQCDDRSRLVHTIRHLGNIYHEDGNMFAAEPLLAEAVNIYREIGDQASLDYANAVRSLAVFYEDIGKTDKALPLLHDAAKLYKAHQIKEGVDEMNRRITKLEN